MRSLLIALVKVYQHTLSPDHGLLKTHYPYGFCRFYPSCSEYAVQTLSQQPLPSALWKIFLRILRCNPLTEPTISENEKTIKS